MTNVLGLIVDGKFDEFKLVTKDMIDLPVLLDKHGENALHWAATKNNVELLEYLCEEKKCYVNMVNYYGASPLYYAAMSNAKEAVEHLISKKADPRLVSAFTRMKPVDAATNLDIKYILSAYTTRFEKILKNPFSNFAYRMADHWRTSMQKLIHPNGERFYNGYPCYPMATFIYKDKGAMMLLDRCKVADAKYQCYFDGLIKDNFKQCLVCESNVEDSDKCKFCGKVSICEECYSNPNPAVRERFEIHTYNCKKGLFSL